MMPQMLQNEMKDTKMSTLLNDVLKVVGNVTFFKKAIKMGLM